MMMNSQRTNGTKWTVERPSIFLHICTITNYYTISYTNHMADKKPEWDRTIQFTEEQQSVVAEIVLFVNSIGLPDHIDQTTFDEVLDIVCDDSPFEWSVSA